MKQGTNIYPVKNLYHEFIKGSELDGIISNDDALKRLESAGLIELIPDKRTGALLFYRWIKTEKMSRPAFESKIRTLLVGEL